MPARQGVAAEFSACATTTRPCRSSYVRPRRSRTSPRHSPGLAGPGGADDRPGAASRAPRALPLRAPPDRRHRRPRLVARCPAAARPADRRRGRHQPAALGARRRAGRRRARRLLRHARSSRPMAGRPTYPSACTSGTSPSRCRTTLTTAFGFSPHEVFRYHNIRTEADRRKILDLYFQNFAAHRISPYDPTPLDPIRVTFHVARPIRRASSWTGPPMTRPWNMRWRPIISPTSSFTSRAWEVERTLAAWSRRSAGTARALRSMRPMFSSYLRQLSDHLRAKGWIKKTYIYWFDEPEPKDYAFVRAGMDPDQEVRAGNSADAHRGARPPSLRGRSISGVRSRPTTTFPRPSRSAPVATGSGGTFARARRRLTARCSSTTRPRNCGSGSGRPGRTRWWGTWCGPPTGGPRRRLSRTPRRTLMTTR